MESEGEGTRTAMTKVACVACVLCLWLSAIFEYSAAFLLASSYFWRLDIEIEAR
jgi:hypothetical protein